jgi:hypothetical protein
LLYIVLNKQGNDKIKKSIVTLILSLTLLGGVSLAYSSSVLIESPLSPSSPNSLATLDLLPFPSRDVELDFSRISLNPRLVSIASNLALSYVVSNNVRLLQQAR